MNNDTICPNSIISNTTQTSLYNWIVGIATLATVLFHIVVYILKKNDVILPVISTSTQTKKAHIYNLHSILTQLQTDIKAFTDSSGSNGNGNGSHHSINVAQ